MREPTEIASVFKETMEKMKGPGVILLAGDPPNPMTIGWGTIGYIWGKWILTVLVRPSRFTFQLMESADEFTVNLMSDACLLYTSPSPRDRTRSRMPSSA